MLYQQPEALLVLEMPNVEKHKTCNNIYQFLSSRVLASGIMNSFRCHPTPMIIICAIHFPSSVIRLSSLSNAFSTCRHPWFERLGKLGKLWWIVEQVTNIQMKIGNAKACNSRSKISGKPIQADWNTPYRPNGRYIVLQQQSPSELFDAGWKMDLSMATTYNMKLNARRGKLMFWMSRN